MKLLFEKLFIIIFINISLCVVAVAQVETNEEIVTRLYEKTGEQYFRVQIPDLSTIQDLSRIISVDKVDRAALTVNAYANRKEFGRFLELGLTYKILPHPGVFEGYLNMKAGVDIRQIDEWDFYPTYEAYIDMMYQFEEEYPALCQVVSIGTSIQGRQLLAVKISDNIGVRENEPQFLYTSSIHGDELTGYVLMLRLIDYLLTNYGSDPRITNMVDNIEIWINPLANPDGTYRAGNHTVNGAIRYNNNWVDLNRNYPDPEDGPHPDGENWQKETQHFMQLAEDNHFVASANIHGGESVCNYPWDTWPRLAADDDWWQYVCHEYADTVHANCPFGYMSDFDNGITNGYQWYSISGGRQDYMNYFQQCREFTLEISNTKLLQPDSLPYYWEYNYRSLLNYLEQSMFGLRGTVRDSVSGWPLNAEVYVVLHELDSSWVYTALPNGNYHRLLAEGNYTVRFSATGYETQVVPGVTITNKQAAVLDIELVPEGVGGIENNSVSGLIRFFPNPVGAGLLHYEGEIEIASVEVYDLSGKMMKETNFDSSSRTLDLRTLEQGLYLVRFETAKGPGIKKILIRN